MKPIPYRIKLGVTGHRRLSDEHILREKIQQAIQNEIPSLFDKKTKQAILKSTHTPIAYTLLSPLAEGADRIVAEEVLKLEHSFLEAIIPLSITDYKETFDHPDDASFERLLNLAKRRVMLRKTDLANDPEVLEGDMEIPLQQRIDESRRDAFENVGRHIVNNCDVLIAIWDKASSNKRGGTAEVVKYAREKNRPVIIIHAHSPYDIQIESGYGLNGQSFLNIDYYNSYRIPQAKSSRYLMNLEEYIFPEEKSKDIPAASKEAIKKEVFPHYIQSSIMAKKSKKVYKPTGNLIYICSALAIVVILAGLLYHPVLLGAFIIEFICLVLILLVYFYSQRYHRRWLESRFLAERLRALIYMKLSGFGVSSIEVPLHMGVAHKHNDWMVQVFTEVWLRISPIQRISRDKLEVYKKFVLEQWVSEQEKYHTEKSSKLARTNRRIRNFGWIIFTIALIAAGIHIFHELMGGLEGLSLFENILFFLAIALPATGAAIVAILKHGEYDRIQTRSDHMGKTIRDLKIDLVNADNVLEFEKRMVEFDQLMLRENQDWLMLMKLVKLEVYP